MATHFPTLLLLNTSNKPHNHRDASTDLPCMLFNKSILQLLCLSLSLKYSSHDHQHLAKEQKEAMPAGSAVKPTGKQVKMEIKPAGTHPPTHPYSVVKLERERSSWGRRRLCRTTLRSAQQRMSPKTGLPTLCGARAHTPQASAALPARSRLPGEDVNPRHGAGEALPLAPGPWVRPQTAARVGRAVSHDLPP